MATKRFGYLDDFSLKDQKVGIGTSTANEKLEVLGGSRSQDIKVLGIATLTSYEGFQNKKTSYVENIDIAGGESGTLSGEVVIGAGLTMSVGTGATTGQGSIDSLKVSNTFTPPIGGTNDRPTAPKPGALYYNKDFRTIEYWDGSFWRQVDYTTRSGRALNGFIEDSAGTDLTTITFVNIQSLGNTQSFGDLTVGRANGAACSSEIRGLFGGGQSSPTKRDTIDYVSIASGGTASDFGNLATAVSNPSSLSSSTRGIWAGGQDPAQSNVIEYVEISTIGNATDFGDLMAGLHGNEAVSSPTRGIFGGGSPSPLKLTNCEYITITNKGNAVKFGDLTVGRVHLAAASNSVRGIFAGGALITHPSSHKTIDYMTIASTGTAIDFGDQTVQRDSFGGAADQTRAVFFAGKDCTTPSEPKTNVIDYIEIATTGNAMDFGDTIDDLRGNDACSDSHGGLGGF